MGSPRPRPGAGLEMVTADGRTWTFRPGALCLEFLVTRGPGEARHEEALHRPVDLVAWLAGSQLGLPAGRIVATATDLAEARRLRDTLWRLAKAWARHEAGDQADVAILNQAASSPCLAPRIEGVDTPGWVLPAGASQVISTIARDAIALRTGPLASRIRECAADGCHLLFLDDSRSGSRRWCSVRRCGNRIVRRRVQG